MKWIQMFRTEDRLISIDLDTMRLERSGTALMVSDYRTEKMTLVTCSSTATAVVVLDWLQQGLRDALPGSNARRFTDMCKLVKDVEASMVGESS